MGFVGGSLHFYLFNCFKNSLIAKKLLPLPVVSNYYRYHFLNLFVKFANNIATLSIIKIINSKRLENQ